MKKLIENDNMYILSKAPEIPSLIFCLPTLKVKKKILSFHITNHQFALKNLDLLILLYILFNVLFFPDCFVVLKENYFQVCFCLWNI